MKTTFVGLALAGSLLAFPAPGSAQISIGAGVGIDISFPTPPPLVVVSPGIRVVPEYEEEVFFVNNYYWVYRENVWYRTHDYRGHWRPVRQPLVPVSIVHSPPGRYRHYYRDDDGYWRGHHSDEYTVWRERHPRPERDAWWREHRRDREVRMEHERSWREHQRQERDERRIAMQREREDRERERRERDMARREHERERRHDGPPPGPRGDGPHHGGPGPGPGPRHGGPERRPSPFHH